MFSWLFWSWIYLVGISHKLYVIFVYVEYLRWLWISAGKKQSVKLMEQERCCFVSTWKYFKPHLLMVLVQVGYSLLYLITKASFNHGMNPYVYVTYRHFVAAILMFPFAYFLERYICSICMSLFLWHANAWFDI